MDKNCLDLKIITTQRDTFFIGANSPDGFKIADRTLYNESLHDRTFILKGSAGGGKSTFIGKCMRSAEKLSASVIDYRCGSDPFSSDGALISKNGKTVFIADGTSPHIADCKLPCAMSEYIDLTKCTDIGKAECRKDEIERVRKMKTADFEGVYSYLKAADALIAIINSVSREILLEEKMSGAVNRLLSKHKGHGGMCRAEYTTCFSMKGEFILDTYIKRAKKIYITKPYFGLENIFMNLIKQGLDSRFISYSYSPSPHRRGVTDAIYIDGANVLFLNVRCPVDGVNVNMKRFASENISLYRGKYIFAQKCIRELYTGAHRLMESAEKYHFEIEKIYKECSDYSYCDRLYSRTAAKYIKSIFS